MRVTLDLAGELPCRLSAYGDGWRRPRRAGRHADGRAAKPTATSTGRARRGRITTFPPASAFRGGHRGVPRGCARAAGHLIARRRTGLSSTGCRRCRTTPIISFRSSGIYGFGKADDRPCARYAAARLHGVAVIGKICRPSRAGAFRARSATGFTVVEWGGCAVQ